MQEVDKTIEAVCVWIQKHLESEKADFDVPAMINALAELVSARAKTY